MRVIKLKGGQMPLERGDLRLLVLDTLKRPMHGYQIICTLRERSAGDYTPSCGALYPQLQSLEEEALVSFEEENGKKVYTLTKKGEDYIKRNKKLVDETKSRFAEFWTTTDYDVVVQTWESIANIWAGGVNDALTSNDPRDLEKIDKSKKLFTKTEKELKEIWT